MPSTSYITYITITTLILLVTLTAGYIYIFGLPPALKRDLERKALRHMGENKASYIVKQQLDQIPDSDQQELKDLKRNVGGIGGNVLQNPLGEQGGEAADEVTRPFTGR